MILLEMIRKEVQDLGPGWGAFFLLLLAFLGTVILGALAVLLWATWPIGPAVAVVVGWVYWRTYRWLKR